MILYLDTRENKETIIEFKNKAPIDTQIRTTAMKTFDAMNEVMGIEFKSIDDFISAVLNITERKDRSEYERMEEQFQRMCEDNRPLKILYLHGSLKNAYSKIHPNSFRGMLASYLARGASASPPVQVCWIGESGFDWIDLVLRLHSKTMKYVEHPEQTVLGVV